LIHKATVKVREEKKYQEKKLKKKMDAFKSILKHLTPPIKAQDSWISIRERVKGGPEFDAISEDDRTEVFGKIIKRLQVHFEDCRV
jgi:pre-mRNA-processing factor 40